MNTISSTNNLTMPGHRLAVVWIACLSAVVFFNLAAGVQATDSAKPATVSASSIWGLEFSPDGKWLAAATKISGHPAPIVIWRVEDWKPHVVQMEPTGGLDVAFSPDGKLLAYGTRSPRVGLIDVASGKLLRHIKALDKHKGSIYSVAFTPDGKSLLTAGSDGVIREWNPSDGSLKRTFKGHTETVHGIAVSPDGSLLLSGSYDHKSRLWDMHGVKTLKVFHTSDLIVRRVGFSRDGRFFLISKYDGTTRIRDTKTQQLRAAIVGSSSATISRDNRLAITASHNTTTDVYRLELDPPAKDRLQRIKHLIAQIDFEDYAVRESASKQIEKIGMAAEPLLREALKSASPEVRIRARRLRKRVMSPQPITKLSGHRGDVEVVCLSPDDKLLATGCRGGDLKIWSVPQAGKTGFKELTTLTEPSAE